MTVLALADLTAASLALGIDFDVSQIADEGLLNREPVISDTGLAAWHAFYPPSTGEVAADIFVYDEAKAYPLTAGVSAGTGHMRPQAQSNSVVWVGNFSQVGRNEDWTLREVPTPQRDQPMPELRAIYAIRMQGKVEEWFEVSATGAPPETAVGAANAAPETATQEVTQAAADTNAPPPVAPPLEPAAESNEARRIPSGQTEICLWQKGGDVQRITHDNRDDLGPSIWGSLIAWQKAKSWPFGWEIMVWADGTQIQLTTNFYYDMAPKVHGSQVAWYGWDGHDFEIFRYDHVGGSIVQITSNEYDDVSPAIWDGVIVWEGYSGVAADIFMYKDEKIQKLSDNIEDDLSPRIWNGQVVWQGFDGDDFEIYLYDGQKTTKLTSNTYDDVNPDLRDGLICWMGYHDNWDAEIFVWDGTSPMRVTDNDYEDRDPRTAGSRVIWQTEQGEKSLIYLATPRK
ncbi:MAG: hypothetical protein V1873_01125 [Verrucomicrobiota bacterium]